jgi:GT2 family glycosyltransferase
MAEPFIVAGGPVRNRGWIIGRHLDSLAAQTVAPGAIFHLLNDSSDETEAVYQGSEWADCYEVFNTGHPGWSRGTRASGWRETDDGTLLRNADAYANLARVRNRWIDRALKYHPQATHLWSVDSDVLPDPDVLEKLLTADEAVVAAVVRNSERTYNFMQNYEYGEPQRSGMEDSYVRNVSPEATFEVTLLGACVLIRREVVSDRDWGAHCRFGPHPIGEDVPFCQAAQAAGFKLWLEPRARTRHFMDGPGKEPLR